MVICKRLFFKKCHFGALADTTQKNVISEVLRIVCATLEPASCKSKNIQGINVATSGGGGGGEAVLMHHDIVQNKQL